MAIGWEVRKRLGSALASRQSGDDLADLIDSPELTGGSVDGATVFRIGSTSSDGLKYIAIDETVTLTNAVEVDLTNTVPSGAVILSVQGNLETAVTGDGTGDTGLTKVGIGTTADPDKYGLSGALTKDQKLDTIPAHAVLGSAEQIAVRAANNSGAAVTEKFTAGGKVRVRVVYATHDSLADAA